MTIGSRVTVRGISGTVSKIVNKGDLYETPPRPYAGESFAVIVDDNGGSHWISLWELGA